MTFIPTTTFIRDMRTLLQIRQFARLRSAYSPKHPISSWWPKEGSPCNLLWDKVAGAGSQPFLLPWSILCWSPDPHVNDIDLPAGAVAPDFWDKAEHFKSVLTSLRSRNLDSSIVLGGVIPQAAAIILFKLLGVLGSQQKSLLTRLIQDPLRDVHRLFSFHKAFTLRLRTQVGSLSEASQAI
jgi:hypothetical protein